MSNDNIFGDPITTPLDATQLGDLLDEVAAGDFEASVGGFKKIEFSYQPLDGDGAPVGALQLVRCRMADAAIAAELSRLQLLAGWLSLTGTPSAATRTQSAYSFAPVTEGGAAGAKVYTLSSGALPDGLSLNAATGAVTGVPTVANTFNFDITVTDADENTDTLTCQIVVAAVPAITTASPLAGATVGRSYTANQTSTGGTAPKVWTASALPTGLAINASTGQITGTPTETASPATILPVLTDANSVASAAHPLELTVAAAVAWSTSSLPGGTVGTAYDQDVTSTGGTAPVAITLASGALPNGLSLLDNGDRTGTISGTPTAAGLFSYVLRATDANGSTADLTITDQRIEIAFTPSGAAMPGATEEAAYSENITANVGAAGAGPATMAITAGALPDGLNFVDNEDGTATISGTPVAASAGSYAFTVTATDTNGFETAHAYTLEVEAAVGP